MGLGKTLTSLAVIQQTIDRRERLSQSDPLNAPATLIVCPLSTLPNWEIEINRHLDMSLTTYVVYHGKEGRKSLMGMEIWSKDIFLATYDTISQCFTDQEAALYGVQWFQIILDEAQYVIFAFSF